MRPEELDRFMAAARRDSSAIAAVSVRLISADKEELERRIRCLKDMFGSELSITQARQSGHGLEWIAYGTFI
jgi:hypothetical protein